MIIYCICSPLPYFFSKWRSVQCLAILLSIVIAIPYDPLKLAINYDSYTNNSFATSKSRRQIHVFGTPMLRPQIYNVSPKLPQRWIIFSPHNILWIFH